MELNQTDITNLLAIIDMATQRGVFKGADLAPVGQLYEKLKSLVDTTNTNKEVEK
jgi:hypothetical protein